MTTPIKKCDIVGATKLYPIVYRRWQNMHTRTRQSHWKHRPTYEGTTVCDEWYLFSNFLHWCKQTANSFDESYQLDKDLFGTLRNNHNHYSPETACFLPANHNKQIGNKPSLDDIDSVLRETIDRFFAR